MKPVTSQQGTHVSSFLRAKLKQHARRGLKDCTQYRASTRNERKIVMKKSLLVIALGLVLFNGAANAAGCLKGAAVGAVAGHVAGHHAVLGAVGGCFVGRHLANKKAAQAKESAQMQTTPEK